MHLKITTLVENSPGEHKGLTSEHGLSFFVEKGDFRLLFDTGQSNAFLHNADRLRIDLRRLDAVVLSHGHYDHSGGFRSLAETSTGFTLYTGKGFFDEKYGVNKCSSEFLGTDFDERFLAFKAIRHDVVMNPVTEICDGVFILSGFQRTHADEVINPRFMVLRNGAFHPDLFEDEIALAIDTPMGLVVLLGCSHPGMKNMLDTARTLLNRPIYAVLGGTHLVEAHGDGLESAMAYLSHESIKVIGVSHCTGKEAMGRISACNAHYMINRTGSSLFVQ